MNGFRDGSITWRALLAKPTPYAPDQRASRAQGHRTTQLDPLNIVQFEIVIEDRSIPSRNPHRRVTIEPGLDFNFLEAVSPYNVVLRGPLPFRSMILMARHMFDVSPGAVASSIAVLELHAEDSSVYIVHSPGETIVQRRVPI